MFHNRDVMLLKAIQPTAMKTNILSVASLPLSVQVFAFNSYIWETSVPAASLGKRFIDIGGQILVTARCAILYPVSREMSAPKIMV